MTDSGPDGSARRRGARPEVPTDVPESKRASRTEKPACANARRCLVRGAAILIRESVLRVFARMLAHAARNELEVGVTDVSADL